MSDEQFLETAGVEADQQLHRLAGNVRKPLPDARRGSHEVARTEVEHVIREQEPQPSALHQERLLYVPVQVRAEVRRCAYRAGGDDIRHQRVAPTRLMAEHEDATSIVAILERHAAGRGDHWVLVQE